MINITSKLLLVLFILTSLIPAAENEKVTKPRVFLDKNPRIVAYQLKRLSDKQIVLVDRKTDHIKYRPVFHSFLYRASLDRKYWQEALASLSIINKTSMMREVLEAISRNDGSDKRAMISMELGHHLMKNSNEELRKETALFEKLAFSSESPVSRKIGFYGLARLEDTKKLWERAVKADGGASALLGIVPMLPKKSEALEGLAGEVEAILEGSQDSPLVPIALRAVTHFGALIPSSFDYLTRQFRLGKHRAVAVSGFLQLPASKWRKDVVSELVNEITEVATQVPPAQRTESEFIDLVRLGREFSLVLPKAEGKQVRALLSELGVTVIIIKTLRDQMLYDRRKFVVEAGEDVEIVLMNEDLMPHNLIITEIGKREEVALAAEKLPPKPDDRGLLYVPKSKSVLVASKMLEPDQTQKLSFKAPKKPGRYPYVCTFPGHWTRMWGTMIVVEDMEEYLANPEKYGEEEKITEWKIDDLAKDLKKISKDRFDSGKKAFLKAGCQQCHKVAGEGKTLGPDLDDVFKRFESNSKLVLEEILNPTKSIREGFENYQIITSDGKTLSGLILKQNEKELTLQTGPNEDQAVKLKTEQVLLKNPQGSSLMPEGLLGTLSREEIIDLMSYLKFSG